MPFQRIAYWNKFGHPEGFLSRTGDYTDMPSLWWIDPQKEQQLNQAIANSSVKLPIDPVDVLYWPAYDKRISASQPTTQAPAGQ